MNRRCLLLPARRSRVQTLLPPRLRARPPQIMGHPLLLAVPEEKGDSVAQQGPEVWTHRAHSEMLATRFPDKPLADLGEASAVAGSVADQFSCRVAEEAAGQGGRADRKGSTRCGARSA